MTRPIVGSATVVATTDAAPLSDDDHRCRLEVDDDAVDGGGSRPNVRRRFEQRRSCCGEPLGADLIGRRGGLYPVRAGDDGLDDLRRELEELGEGGRSVHGIRAYLACTPGTKPSTLWA